MFRYRAIGSVSHAISVWMFVCVYNMHFWTRPTHTDLTAAHLSSVCAQNSLTVLPWNEPLWIQCCGCKRTQKQVCVCVLVFSSSSEMKMTVSFSSTWLPNACTTVLVRLVLISSAVILGFLLWVSQRWSLSEMENSVIFSPSCHFFFSFFRTQNETLNRMFMLFFLKGCLRAFSL